VLRHVSPAFAEDPLRVLRVARFAARFDFSVADETVELMRALVEAGEMEALVAERVWQELERALGEEHPARFFEVLRQCGALARLFPEIEALFGVPQPPEHHPEIDTGVHTLMVLTQAARLSPDARVRFAALLHDLGKGRTPPQQWPTHNGHEELGVILVQALCRRFRAPNEYLDLAVLVARYHAHCHRAPELRDGTLLDTLERLDVFRRRERLELFLAACEADARGRYGYEQRPYPQADIFRRAFQAANAVDASALAAGDLSGPAIAAKLREQRLDAIHAARASFK